MKLNKDVYLITKDYPDFNTLLYKTEEALNEGISILQYRSKVDNQSILFKEASSIKKLCDTYGTTLIINDHVNIALEVGADGVHLGQKDTDMIKARHILGEDFIIGVTAKTVIQAINAYKQGADYLGVGALYPSSSKLDAVQISIDALINIKKAVPLPIVGIGGITADNISNEILRQVDSVAVISEIYDASNIKDAVSKLMNVLKKGMNGYEL